jgi:glycerol uptake facilitator-like aquaporin
VNPAVSRRLAAEFTGTGLLVAIVVGSGIAATNLTTDAPVPTGCSAAKPSVATASDRPSP